MREKAIFSVVAMTAAVLLVIALLASKGISTYCNDFYTIVCEFRKNEII